MVFNVLKSSGHQLPDIVRGWNVIVGDLGKKPPALRDPERGIDDCFGCKSMNGTVLQPKDVAHQMESANLATAVGEQLVAPHRAFDHLVHVFRGLRLAEDLGAAVVFELGEEDLRAGLSIVFA